uniref:basic proline-rich protein-like n=1 Tax=Lonchura striata TaxID=40157 RepID=UPI000B4CC25C|nr:basic proline-rich protein-like [Lonchura striata domestica]
MEHSRNGPTSHPLQGTVTAAQRAHALSHTHPARCRVSPHTHALPPCPAPPRGRAGSRGTSPPSATSSALPSAAPGGPGPPPPWCPPIRSRGAGGRGECPVGPAPPRAPLPGGDHAHSPPQEGITQGSLLLICIHLQAGYSPHFLTACHRQRPVPAVSPSWPAQREGPPAVVPRGRCRCLPAPGAATEVTYRSGGFTAPPASPAGALPPPCPPFTPAAPGGTRSAGRRPPAPLSALPAAPDPSPAAPRTRAPPPRRGCQLVPVTGNERRAGRRGLPAAAGAAHLGNHREGRREALPVPLLLLLLLLLIPPGARVAPLLRAHHHLPDSGGGAGVARGRGGGPGAAARPGRGGRERSALQAAPPGYSWHHFPEQKLPGERGASAGSAPPVTSPGPPARRRERSRARCWALPPWELRGAGAAGAPRRGGRAPRRQGLAGRSRGLSPPAEIAAPLPLPPRELPGEPVPTCRAQAARPPGLRISSEDAGSSCPLPSLRFLSLPPPAPPPPRSRLAEITLSVKENNTPPGLPVPAAGPRLHSRARVSPGQGPPRPSLTPQHVALQEGRASGRPGRARRRPGGQGARRAAPGCAADICIYCNTRPPPAPRPSGAQRRPREQAAPPGGRAGDAGGRRAAPGNGARTLRRRSRGCPRPMGARSARGGVRPGRGR